MLAQIEIDPRYNEPSTIDGLSGKRQELILVNWPTLKDLALASRLEFFAVHGIGAVLFDTVVKHFVSRNMFCHIGMRERSSMYVSKPYTGGPYGYISTPEVRRINKCDSYSWKLPKGIISSSDEMSFVLSIGSMYSNDSLEINLLDEIVPQSESENPLIASPSVFKRESLQIANCLFESHDWVKNYQDYEAVLRCLNPLSEWDKKLIERAFQTFMWDHTCEPGGELEFAHENTPVVVRLDGAVVAILFGTGDLNEALPDLFAVLHSLGWVNAVVYHPFETSALFLTDVRKAIPAHAKLNIELAESIK